MLIEPYTNTAASFLPYDPDAPDVARLLSDAICGLNPILAAEHVGSTSVPGLGGKGIVDIMLLYPPGALAPAKHVLEQLGFQHQTTRDPFPEDRPMRTGSVLHNGKRYRIHVHVIAADSTEAATLRAFRDRLRSDPALRHAYEACKQNILAAGITDSVDYSESKGEFIQTFLAKLK